MMNWRKIKKIQRNANGMIAVLSFLITMNLIREPATKIAIKLLIGQASGRTKISITPSESVSTTDIPMMATVLLRKIVRISMK